MFRNIGKQSGESVDLVLKIILFIARQIWKCYDAIMRAWTHSKTTEISAVTSGVQIEFILPNRSSKSCDSYRYRHLCWPKKPCTG